MEGKVRSMSRFKFSILASALGAVIAPSFAQTPTGNPTETAFRDQDYQRPNNCLPCHQRQFDELRSSVKSGYRNVSPLFNGLETSSNLLTGGLLRPVYGDNTVQVPGPAGSPITLNTNMFTSSPLAVAPQVRAGLCYTCHDPPRERQGERQLLREGPEVGATTGRN